MIQHSSLPQDLRVRPNVAMVEENLKLLSSMCIGCIRVPAIVLFADKDKRANNVFTC